MESTVMEIQKVVQHPSSWFIGNYLESNGSLFVCTPVDPLFLVLPFLQKSRNKSKDQGGYFLELSIILKNEDFPAMSLLATMLKNDQLSLICDVKDGWNSAVYRLNDEHLQKWLRSKVENVRTLLEGHHAFDSVFVADEDKLKHMTVSAVGLVAEYLPKEILQVVLDEFSLTNADVFAKKKK